jgi:hypothetical protein
MYPDALSNIETLLKSIWCPVFRNRRFLWLIEPYVSHMFLASGLYRAPSLADVYFPTLTGNTIHTRDFKTQVVFDGPEQLPVFLYWYVNLLDIVFC